MRPPLPFFGTRAWSLVASTSQNAALGAALALVGIQVGIGLIMKSAQKNGQYAFSPSASVAIAEFLKLLLSTGFFWRECKTRAARSEAPHWPSSSPDSSNVEAKPFLDDEERLQNGNGNGSVTKYEEEDVERILSTRLDLRTFWQYVRYEVSLDVRYGFAQLALFYVLINNLIFVSYKLADPGTIQLTKSGVTLITALVMIVTLGTKISKVQWIAIVIQICGLAVTQYHPETGSTYPFSTYIILIFQVFLSASSGVYNQALLKTGNASLHASNMTLYAAGATINVMLHLVMALVKSDEPGFFTGYGSWGAILVIMSNVFIGLAITAVYKYADAVIKCFATAVSTGILLCLSPILFNTDLTFLMLPGTVMVFIASWLYMESPPPKETLSQAEQASKDQAASTSIYGKLLTLSKLYRNSVLATFTGLTILICAFTTMSDALLPDLSRPGGSTKSQLTFGANKTIESPFKNSLAIIRWNSEHPERMPLLSKYTPFFHTVQFSMPHYLEHEGFPDGIHNLTHDSADDSAHIYRDLANTMKLVLDAPAGSPESEIDGMLYFHFDAWIDPLGYFQDDFTKMWFPDIPDIPDAETGKPGGPRFECMVDKEKYAWWGWTEQNFDEQVQAANRLIAQHEGKYVVNLQEWCSGWTDIYFVPRKYFADYIFLSGIFGGLNIFHEVAIPTIIHIIDQSRRAHPNLPILTKFGECWGSCCAKDPDVHDVLNNRCGHRLDYRNETVTNAHYDKLDAEAGMLGDQVFEPKFPTIAYLKD